MRRSILAVKDIPSHTKAYRLTIKVEGGLQYLRGNSAPYFSLTADIHRKGHPNQCQSGGCCHDLILKHFPKFADLAALHLCDMDGTPMHGTSNGWYNLAAVLPEFAGQKYHVGNSERHYPKPEGAPRRGDWDNTDYRKPTQAECMAIVAEYFRITIKEASDLRESVIGWALEGMVLRQQAEEAGASAAGVYKSVGRYDWQHARAEFDKWVERQKPRWKAEAEACIAKHGLVVFGDKWEVVA
jgi:hypothetical protein